MSMLSTHGQQLVISAVLFFATDLGDSSEACNLNPNMYYMQKLSSILMCSE